MLSDFVKAANVTDVSDGEMKGVLVDGVHILLAHIGDEFFAINNICSHMFTYLEVGDLWADTCEVQCPLHESRFSLRTGEFTDPPADTPVEAYAVRIEGDAIMVGPRSLVAAQTD